MSTLQNADENRAITLTETGHTEMTYIYKNMKKKFSRLLVGFGAAQIVIGVLCIVINGITLGLALNGSRSIFLAHLSYGFIPGLMFIVAGAIGLAAGKGKKKCQVISSNVLCIISASLCSYLFICSVIAASIAREICYYSHSSDAHMYMYNCHLQQDRTIALEAVLAVLALLEVGCAIGSSVVTCSIGACCCDCDCGCCCPPIMPQKATSIPYQQPATFVLQPSQPTYYMPVANQMTIPSGQQQPMILLNPNQLMAQYNPQQVAASSNVQTQETSGMNGSSTGENEYEPLSLNTSKR